MLTITIENIDFELKEEIDLPGEMQHVAAQLAGVSSLLQVLRLQTDSGVAATGDSLFALQIMVDNLNIVICNLSDTILTRK